MSLIWRRLRHMLNLDPRHLQLVFEESVLPWRSSSRVTEGQTELSSEQIKERGWRRIAVPEPSFGLAMWGSI
jgi:hypothetical protein